MATAGHPFWSVSDAAWVDAGDLQVGDAVLEADGTKTVVTATTGLTVEATVFNLTVADIHTYFVVVGDAATLVHNCGSSASPFSFERTHSISGRESSRNVKEIAELMRTGQWQGPAIDVIESNRQRIVVDGHHRLASAKLAGVEIEYRVVDPTEVLSRPGGWKSLEEILNDAAIVGPNRLRP